MLDTLPPITSTVLRAKTAHDVRFPHRSWRASLDARSGENGAVIRTAGDFWSRLGL